MIFLTVLAFIAVTQLFRGANHFTHLRLANVEEADLVDHTWASTVAPHGTSAAQRRRQHKRRHADSKDNDSTNGTNIVIATTASTLTTTTRTTTTTGVPALTHSLTVSLTQSLGLSSAPSPPTTEPRMSNGDALPLPCTIATKLDESQSLSASSRLVHRGVCYGATELLLHQKSFKQRASTERVSTYLDTCVRNDGLVRSARYAAGNTSLYEAGLLVERLRFPLDVVAGGVLPKDDVKRERSGMHATCAVVGNAGALLKANNGTAIDAHDAVFRLNLAPTKGYEQHVGSRTTYDISNHANANRIIKTVERIKARMATDHQHLFALPQDSGATWPGRLAARAFLRARPYLSTSPVTAASIEATAAADQADARLVLFESTLHASRYGLYARVSKSFPHRMWFVHPGFHASGIELWRDVVKEVKRAHGSKSRLARMKYAKTEGARIDSDIPKPLSGWFAVLVAAQLCQTISLYGFEAYVGGASRGDGVNPDFPPPYHYFDSVEGQTTVHSFPIALEAMQKLPYNVTVKG